MNIICSGTRYQVYDTEDIKTYSKLPVGTYEVCFNQNIGFYLTAHTALEVKEEKIYGSTLNRIDKILLSFEKSERNFGVILSGDKGSGKSLFARELSKKCLEKEIPVIIVNIAAPGIASFLASIEQEVMILFDEFEKTFSFENDCGEKSELPQEELLSLFDGLDSGKKLFVITCNDTYRLSSYLLNRPGRFHYHFKLGVVTPEDMREYMSDKLLPKYHYNIEKLINVSNFVDMTYDLLRAIVFDLNQGYELEETLSDLNVDNKDSVLIEATLTFENGSVYKALNSHLYFSKRDCLQLFDRNRVGVNIFYYAKDLSFNGNKVVLNKYTLSFDDQAPESDKQSKVKELTIKIKNEYSFNFINSFTV